MKFATPSKKYINYIKKKEKKYEQQQLQQQQQPNQSVYPMLLVCNFY